MNRSLDAAILAAALSGVAELGYDGDESYVANWADSVTKLDANFSQLAGVVYFDDKEGHPWPENYGLPDWRVA